jgi:hypothetical protein
MGEFAGKHGCRLLQAFRLARLAGAGQVKGMRTPSIQAGLALAADKIELSYSHKVHNKIDSDSRFSF